MYWMYDGRGTVMSVHICDKSNIADLAEMYQQIIYFEAELLCPSEIKTVDEDFETLFDLQ